MIAVPPQDTVRTSTIPSGFEAPVDRVRYSAQFNVLRVGACLAVILLHLAATIVMDRQYLGTIHWHLSNVIDAATRWCVPVFVMLSGALLLSPEKHGRAQDFWVKRMNRLLPALVVWPAIYFLWRAFYRGEPLSLAVVAHDLAVGRPYIHLYFLFLIGGLYVVTPFLSKTIYVLSLTELRSLVLVLAGLAMGAYLFDYLSSSVFILFVPYVAYYLAGWYYTQATFWSSKTTLIAFSIAAVATTLLTELLVPLRGFDDNWAFYFYEDFTPTTMVMAAAVFVFVLRQPAPYWIESLAKGLAPLTLGVYLAHPIVVELLRYAYVYAVPNLLRPPYYIPVTFFLTCALAFPLVALMRLMPGLRRIV